MAAPVPVTTPRIESDVSANLEMPKSSTFTVNSWIES